MNKSDMFSNISRTYSYMGSEIMKKPSKSIKKESLFKADVRSFRLAMTDLTLLKPLLINSREGIKVSIWSRVNEISQDNHLKDLVELFTKATQYNSHKMSRCR